MNSTVVAIAIVAGAVAMSGQYIVKGVKKAVPPVVHVVEAPVKPIIHLFKKGTK